MGAVVWRFEILDESPETVAEWLAYTSGIELLSVVRIKDTPYRLTRHRVSWAETPYRVLLPVWGPLPLKEQLTPWSIQCEINEVNEGTEVVARYNAGDGLLEQFDHLMSALQDHWPGAKMHQSIEMRTDGDPDRAIDDYFEGSARLFIDWLAERIGSGLLLEAPAGWAISIPPPRVGHLNTLETLAMDVELLEVRRRGEEEGALQQIDRCPESIRFSARAYNLHNGTVFRVQSTCHDLYRANCEEVRALQDVLGMGRIDRWPIVEPPPVAVFFEGLWEQIRASWRSPEQGLPQVTGGAALDEDYGRDKGIEQPKPDWLPQQGTLDKKWKPIWRLWLKMKREYQGEWDEGHLDNPEPRIAELSDRVKFEFGWNYSERRLRDIVRAGEEGCLAN